MLTTLDAHHRLMLRRTPTQQLRHSRASFRHSCAGRNPRNPHRRDLPFPNSSLPPSRVSCKMPNFGGSADQALSGRHLRVCAGSAILQETPFRGRLGGGWNAPNRHRRSYTPRSPTPTPLPHPCALFRHSCAGRNPPRPAPSPAPTPSPIHPSPLKGGRLGGGWNAPSRHRRPARPDRPRQPLSLISAPLSVIPAQAGTYPPHNTRLHPNSSLPPKTDL